MLRAGTARTWRGAVTTRTSKKERTSPMASRVLLIDDDVRLYELLASYLEQNGFTVTCVADAAKGLAALSAGPSRPGPVAWSVDCGGRLEGTQAILARR